MANNLYIRNIKIEADAQGQLPKTIQLLRAGSWNTPWHGDFDITPEDIQQFVANYQANIGLPDDSEGKIQVNYSHRSHDKAAGWLTDLRAEEVDGVLSLMGDVEWTPAAAQALADGEYRYISPEFNPRALPWEDPEQEWRMVANVLTGAGLTNIPLFKKLKKVAASERPEPTGSSKRNKGDEPMTFKLEEVRQKEASAITDDERTFLESKKSELSADELTKFNLKADETPKEEEEQPEPTKVEASAQSVTISASELADLKANAARGLQASQKLEQKEASDFADARISAGQVKSSEKDKLTSILLASSADARKDLEDFLTGLPVNASIGTELGGSGASVTASAHDDLHTKVVQQIQADVDAGKVRPAYAQVRASVLAADADLAKRIKDEEDQ